MEKEDREARLKFLLMEAALRPPSQPSQLDSALNASVSVRSTPSIVPKSWHRSPSLVPRKGHKTETVKKGRSLAPKAARHGNQIRVQSKPKHSSASVPQKLAPFTLVPMQAPSNPVPEELSTSAAQHDHTRGACCSQIPVSLAVQELVLSVPVDRREPTGSCHCSVPCPLLPSKGKLAMLSSVKASPSWHQSC